MKRLLLTLLVALVAIAFEAAAKKPKAPPANTGNTELTTTPAPADADPDAAALGMGEDAELFGDATHLDTDDLLELAVRFAFNFFFCWVIIRWLYYPKSRRRDFYFTFIVISVSIFCLIYLLGSVKIKVGFALGLFAIFGIIRYRTESMSVREMTYLFVVIAVSVINALAVSLSYAELVITNILFIACIKFSENIRYLPHESEKLVLYDRIDLITPDRRDELIADLSRRLGLDIKRVELGATDFLRDTVMIKVYYTDPAEKGQNSVNRMLKFPKENQ